MTITAKSCAEFLREHNEWRRGGEGNMQTPYEIGRHIDFAIGVLEQAIELEKELETERALSFRNQVAGLEKQRDELLAALEINNFYLTAIVNGAEIDAEETNIKVSLNGDEIKVINLAETIRSAESTIASAKEN